MSKSIGIKDWTKIRKPVIERDNYACRICGKDAVEAQLNVHHIDYDRKNNRSTNLITLCSTCHKAVHLERYIPIEHEDWPAPWGNVE